MTCQDCSRLDIQNASLQRQLDRAEADNRELERERAGLLASVTRLQERLLAALDGSGQVDRP